MSTVNLKENVIFEKSILISKNEGSIQNQELTTGTVGQLRFNQTSRKFEGFHCVANSNAGADIFGNKWRPFTQDVASTSNLGIFRVGTNLTMNATTGILSSIASGESRIYQLVITVSPIVGAADYQTINTAISHAIGTPANNYTDGTLTSNLGSAPSPTYPFVIQLGPGQYSESLNKIILPDYVSLRGENNYNSVITQNNGSNGSITDASMLIVGENSEIKNLVINLADTVSSSNTNAIYSLNKSNVVIDNCIISCSSNITTTQNTYGIFMDGGDNNSITNNKVDFNSNTLLGNLNTISITNSTPRLINNYINILAPNISISNGINLNNCIGTESISDTVYIENLTLSNNYYNTLTTSINTGIFMNNTPVILKNSDIEVSNDPSLTTNYGIQFKSVPNSLANPLPYSGNTTSNIISFVNVTNGINIGQNLINSSNTSALNFLTANYQRGQYVNVSGSSSNNGIYKIASLTSSSLTLENGFNLISEAKTALNTITLKGLFNMNIYNTRINGSTNSIKNNNNNSNYICNLYDIINETSAYSISPSFVFYRNYKTLTVGKVNCDFNNLYNAMTSITDNNSMTRYLIKIQSGIYHETSYITCKEFVDIEGNGEDNTILQFYQAANTSGTPMNTTSCILLCSNITIKNITIKNSPTLYTAGQTTSTVFYNPNPITNPITNLILENIIINSTCSSVYNTGIYIVNGSSLTLRNIDLVIYSTNTAVENTGITAKECNTFNLYNISSTIDSGFSLVSHALHLTNSSCNIYNPNFLTHSAVNYNSGVYSYSTNTTQKLIQIYNGQIRSYDAVEYSIYTDNYYTIMCNGAQLLGDTFENSISSRLYCNSCYTFTDENDKTNIQSLNSRGQNEQSLLTYKTLTIGDTAGKLNSTGSDNVFVGVNSGSNVTTASNNTFLGYNTGKTLNIAGNNTLIGSSVGQSITTGTGNTITGSNAGINLSTGNTNTITGAYAGKELTTGFGNTINGTSSGLTLTTGFRNTFMGDGSGLYSNTSVFNTFIGSLSGYDNNSGNYNTYLGYQSGYEGISSNNNVFIGTSSGYTNQSSNIVALGAQSGYNNTSSIKNTYIGHQSGYNNVTGDCNTYLGYNAGYSAASASGDFNIAIGNEAGYSITSGARNVLIGSTKNATSGSNDAAGWSLQNGTDNIHIGVNTGSQATSAINNVFIGSDIGTSITTASNNILIGKNTGNSITNNDGNIIIGSETGNDNTYGNALIIGQNSGVGHTGSPAFVIGHNAGKNIEGVNNMFIGQSSGGISQTGKTGNYNLAIGPFSGFNLKAGSRNIIVGTGDSLSSAGGVITSGSDNTLLGFNSGRAVQTGVGNTLIGSNAGANLTSGANNLILGYKSAYTLGTGSNNISLGPEAGYNLTGGNGNIFSGYRAGYNTTSGFNNINIGVQSGYQSQTTRNNIHIGYQSGYQSIANNNLFLGSYSGLQNTTGIDNIFVGSNSGAGYNTSSQQIGNYNIFMGSDTGKSNFDGTRNIYLGLNSGKNNINGSKNVYIGENTGRDSVVSRNIFIGTTSDNTKGVGYKAQSAGGLDTGDKNVFIGHDVGIENTSGKGNIFLGDSAGQKNTTGEQNIYIGKNAGNKANASTADYNIALGYNSGQNNLGGKENILIGKEVASITTNSYNQNIIIGSEAGQYINQDNQIFIGTKAGQNNTTGDNNIFIGKDAGKENSISNDNVVIGSDAGTFLVGNGLIGDNTIIGANAAHDLTTGTNNIYIGSSAGLTAVSSINNVVIGANSMSNGDANNVVIIGNNAGQNNTANANIFIGSNAGVQNTTGIGNIFIGKESGYNVNSNGNIIFGTETVSTGRIADNNIIFGNETAKNVANKTNFQNNIIMGSNAGKDSNLSINSIMIGSDSVNVGTGGDVNIIIGNNTAINLGNPNLYYATTTTEITTAINYLYIDIPFGTGGFYFTCNDFIIIESLNNEYVFESQIIVVEAGAGVNLDTTKLTFNTKPIETIPIGSILYVKNVKANGIGLGDYSKASSNMCLGDQCGFELTTGSKNSAIGDNAMYNNKVGKYNITLGTESGYNLNSNNNLCLGINSGYSLDKYKNTNTITDLNFYQNNNTITSTIKDFSQYYYGTVFDIEGSSSNDARYYVKDNIPKAVSGETYDQLIVQGNPSIIENGLSETVSQSVYTVGSSIFYYINFTTENLAGVRIDIVFDQIFIVFYANATINAVFNKIKNMTHFTIKNSNFNNGIKIVNNQIAFIEIIFGTIIRIYTYEHNLPEVNANTILEVNNISVPNDIVFNGFNSRVFAGDKLNIQFGLHAGVYKNNIDVPYFLKNGEPNKLFTGTVIEDTILTNGIDSSNQCYVLGNTTSISISNIAFTVLHDNPMIFDPITNTISGISRFSRPFGPLLTDEFTNSLMCIYGTNYNNGYYFVTNVVIIGPLDYKVYIDKKFKLVSETINYNAKNVVFEKVQINNSYFGNFINSSPSFQGNIIRAKTRTDSYQNFTFGTYIVNSYYNGWFGLTNNIVKYSPYPKIPRYQGWIPSELVPIDVNFTFTDTNIKALSTDYISSTDLIYQVSDTSFSNITIYSSNSTITTTVLYEFIDIVAPVMIKIENSTFNNGFYLVTSNPRPFDKLTIKQALVDETSNIIIKTKCISSYFRLLDLTYLQFNTEYKIYGSKYNDEKAFTLYNDANAVSSVSVYLSDDTTIVNDSYNDFYYSIAYDIQPSIGQNDYNVVLCNQGDYQHINMTNLTISVVNSTTIDIGYTGNATVETNLDLLINNTYLSLINTPSNTYDGLYCISSITDNATYYRIAFNTKYQRNNIIYTTPDPFTGAPASFVCELLVNQFVLYNGQVNIFNILYYTKNPDFHNIISGFGENAKFLSFYSRNGHLNQVPYSASPSSLFGTVDNTSHLTFEVESFNLNVSNISVSLVETCPNITNNGGVYQIDFGQPNPTTRTSDIYRKKTRPIMFSESDISFDSYFYNVQQGIPLTFTNSGSTNTITVIPTSDYPYWNSCNLYYGSLLTRNNFKNFMAGQYIYIQSNLNINIYLIDSVSDDFLTLYINPSYPVVNEVTQGAIFSFKYTFNDASLDFTQFNASYFNSNYKLLLYKLPTGIDFSIPDSLINTSVVNFPVSDIYAKNVSNFAFSPSVYPYATSNITTKLQEFCMDNAIIIPSTNINDNYTHLSFHNLTITGSSDISFYTSNNTITSTTTDISSFKKSEYIFISNTISNNGLFRINDTTAPTTNSIIISNEYTLANETNKSAILNANNINTSNSSFTDLSVFSGSQKVIITSTNYNNTIYTSNINSNSAYSIYIDSSNVTTETPNFCNIEKSILINEGSVITGSSNINFNNNEISVSNSLTDLSNFRVGQTLQITNTTNNNSNITISDTIPISNSITTIATLTNESTTSATLTKKIDFSIIGEPVQAVINAYNTTLYHYEDAQGNNAMIGSFAGNYCGSLNNAIYNVSIGSRCAQINHGSGNIFIGSESKLATSATQNGATTYNNKFAIYKNNFVGVSPQPLIGGDFATGRVGINTINPENFNTVTDVSLTDTKLVVNGSIIANSYSPFTGCHIVNFVDSNVALTIKPGMIVSTSGKVLIKSIINTYCSVDISKVKNDKTVFGVYVFNEQTNTSSEPEYIIFDKKYMKNTAYSIATKTLYYSASIGEGCVLVCNYGGEIQNGDYITTCPIGGYGSLQSDDILHSYTVAKCTETINWSLINETVSYNGQLYKVFLTSCTYHCG